MRLFFTHVILCIFILKAAPQINSCYSYAEGNTQGVTITWDTYTLNSYDEIVGCNIYKRFSWNDTLFQLNEELITSLDTNYFYFDTGNFIGTFPPCYVVEAVPGLRYPYSIILIKPPFISNISSLAGDFLCIKKLIVVCSLNGLG